jgi:biopolymer transport protein ExbD
MEMESNEYKLVKVKPRCKKLNPRIDLTAMVSISFLLIIFFMVTKELSRPRMIDLGLPESSCGPTNTISCGGRNFDRTITLLLDDDNKVISYWGLLEMPNEQPKKLDYGKDGIRKELQITTKKFYKLPVVMIAVQLSSSNQVKNQTMET